MKTLLRLLPQLLQTAEEKLLAKIGFFFLTLAAVFHILAMIEGDTHSPNPYPRQYINTDGRIGPR